MTPELADAVEKGASVSKLREIAKQQGLVDLSNAGIEQVFAGRTTLEEVYYKLSS